MTVLIRSQYICRYLYDEPNVHGHETDECLTSIANMEAGQKQYNSSWGLKFCSSEYQNIHA